MVTNLATTAKPRDLQPRDIELLEHVRRYRITVPEALATLPGFRGLPLNAITKVTSRLREREYLSPYRLLDKRIYFMLGRNAARMYQLSTERWCKALGMQALANDYGTLFFCRLMGRTRERITRDELQQSFPDFLEGEQRGIDSTRYYWDRQDTRKRLASIRVDFNTTISRIVSHCANDIAKRLRVPALRRLILNDQYLISIVTLRPERKAQIEAELKNRRHPVKGLIQERWPVKFRVKVCPDLVPLLEGLSRA